MAINRAAKRGRFSDKISAAVNALTEAEINNANIHEMIDIIKNKLKNNQLDENDELTYFSICLLCYTTKANGQAKDKLIVDPIVSLISGECHLKCVNSRVF